MALLSQAFILSAQYREVGTIVMSAVLGLLMAFIACRRLVLHPPS